MVVQVAQTPKYCIEKEAQGIKLYELTVPLHKLSESESTIAEIVIEEKSFAWHDIIILEGPNNARILHVTKTDWRMYCREYIATVEDICEFIRKNIDKTHLKPIVREVCHLG